MNYDVIFSVLWLRLNVERTEQHVDFYLLDLEDEQQDRDQHEQHWQYIYYNYGTY